MKQCFECEKTEDQCDIHDHHIIPKSRGGTKTIPLCIFCHGLVHDKNLISMRELMISSIKERKKNGEVVGHPIYGYSAGPNGELVENADELSVIARTIQLRKTGSKKKTWRQVAQILNNEGHTNRAGNPWRLHNAWAVLKDRI